MRPRPNLGYCRCCLPCTACCVYICTACLKCHCLYCTGCWSQLGGVLLAWPPYREAVGIKLGS
jgi:hypothetical protein